MSEYRPSEIHKSPFIPALRFCTTSCIYLYSTQILCSPGVPHNTKTNDSYQRPSIMGLREKLARFDGSDKAAEKAAEASKDKETEEDPLPTYTEAEASSSQSPQFQSRFASLSLHGYDMLRFLHFPTPVIDLCRTVIQQTWTRNIKSESEYGGAHQFKLHGFPWTGSGGQTTEARRMICRLLEVLHGQGWVLMISTSISKKQMEKDTMLFRHQIPAPAPCDWAAIGFSKMDRIRFMDGMTFG